MVGELILFALVGFAAQLVDGAVGMAYGLAASSALQALAVAPAVASASVHAAEIVTTGVSGLAHWRLAGPGVAGGVIGATLLSDLPLGVVRPAVGAYLALMGLLILWRALRPLAARPAPTGVRLAMLGATGGFLDAVGGGGWGPLVASTLIGRGGAPRAAIGSTNAAEFFVTCAITATFLLELGLELWPAILGLVLGGVAAAPLAALLTRRLPVRALLAAVGLVVSLLGARTLLRALA